MTVRVAIAAGFLLIASATPAAASHRSGHRDEPTGPAPVEFAADFEPPLDDEYGFPLGGFGGTGRRSPLRHLPVVFVHGNQADAQNWYEVRDQFRAAGYADQELWALSYGGLGYVGGSAPVTSVPDSELDYVAGHPQAGLYGNPQANDVNVPDLLAFIAAVREYTGAERVQVVAHSLGVTIVRKAMVVHPPLRQQIEAVVAIAGANHGTSVCRGLEESYYGCDEIAPGTPWLARVNAFGEAPPPTRWMTVYDGSGFADVFYGPQDADSPRLEGAHNVAYPGTSHNDLRVEPAIVEDYLVFLREGQEAVRPAPPPPSGSDETSEDGSSAVLPTTGGNATPLAALLTIVASTIVRRRSSRSRR